MIQEALFGTPVQVSEPKHAGVPPTSTKPVATEPLGSCVKCGKDATLLSPGGSLYCAECGRCRGKSVEQTALGIEVKVCGRSVEKFVMHPRMGIWVCPCLLLFDERIDA
jgi:hypothetical protein